MDPGERLRQSGIGGERADAIVDATRSADIEATQAANMDKIDRAELKAAVGNLYNAVFRAAWYVGLALAVVHVATAAVLLYLLTET